MAIKLFGTQVLAIRRMAAGFMDIRQVYVDAPPFELDFQNQNEEECGGEKDHADAVGFTVTQGGMLSSSRPASTSLMVAQKSRPPSVAGGRINTPFLSTNDADFDRAESIHANVTLFRTGDVRHGDIVLVWLTMPWDPSYITPFACRLAASVGCHCAIVRVTHLSGSSSITAAAAAVVEDITAALATIEHRCILLGGCEVAGTVALHAITANSFGDGPPVAALLFDPFVGWRTTVVTPATESPASSKSGASNSTQGSATTSQYYGAGGEIIEERADPSLSLGLEETTVGALVNRFATDVDAWYGGRIRSWFPSWLGSTSGPAASTRSPSMSPKTRASQFGATAATYNNGSRPPALTLASPVKSQQAKLPEAHQAISCTILMCCDSQNVWAHQLRDFQRCLAVRGVDIALEEYVSANPDPIDGKAYLLGFMEDCEMWLEKAANVGRFACGSSVFSQGTRRSGVAGGAVNTWTRRFRSLAGASRSLTPVSVVLGHSASTESLFESYLHHQHAAGMYGGPGQLALPCAIRPAGRPWPGAGASADSISCATTPIKGTPIAGNALGSLSMQARRRPSLPSQKKASEGTLAGALWGSELETKGIGLEAKGGSKDSVRDEGFPVDDVISTPRPKQVIVRSARTPRVSTNKRPTRVFDTLTPIQ